LLPWHWHLQNHDLVLSFFSCHPTLASYSCNSIPRRLFCQATEWFTTYALRGRSFRISFELIIGTCRAM
jgi:hypothetical protein